MKTGFYNIQKKREKFRNVIEKCTGKYHIGHTNFNEDQWFCQLSNFSNQSQRKTLCLDVD